MATTVRRRAVHGFRDLLHVPELALRPEGCSGDERWQRLHGGVPVEDEDRDSGTSHADSSSTTRYPCDKLDPILVPGGRRTQSVLPAHSRYGPAGRGQVHGGSETVPECGE